MTIGAYLVVGPGEADRYLEPVLKQLHWVDVVCVLLNNVDDKTRKMVGEYADVIEEDNREWGINQFRLKQDFLDKIGTKADWWWCLDADEIFDPRFNREMAEQMASGHDIAWYFFCLQLWNDENRVRLDMSFPNVRYYKYLPDFEPTFQATALHCGLAPRYAYAGGSQSGLYFKHYGLMTAESRRNKVARYDKYDPKAKYKGKSWYDALRNEKASSISLDEAVSRLPESIYKHKAVRKPMRNREPIYMFRNLRGKAVPACGEIQRDQFRKIGYTELQTIVEQSGGEAPLIKAVTPTHEPIKVEAVQPAEPPASAPKKRGRPSKASGSSKDAGEVLP